MLKADQDGAVVERAVPSHRERIAVHALSRSNLREQRGDWPEAAKHRLYVRMFPDQTVSTTGAVSHVKPAA